MPETIILSAATRALMFRSAKSLRRSFLILGFYKFSWPCEAATGGGVGEYRGPDRSLSAIEIHIPYPLILRYVLVGTCVDRTE